MAARLQLVLGPDGIPQQLQAGDTLASPASGSNANGKYLVRADGVIEQSGVVTLSNGTATITFPIPFPKACDWVGPTALFASTSATDCSVYLTGMPTLTTAGIGGTTTTLGVTSTIVAGAFKVLWRATGS